MNPRVAILCSYSERGTISGYLMDVYKCLDELNSRDGVVVGCGVMHNLSIIKLVLCR
jgi:hypothetical protein